MALVAVAAEVQDTPSDASVSGGTRPVAVGVNTGLAKPQTRVTLDAVMVSVAGVTVSVPAA